MTVGSLFAGIGGFDLAAERVGWQVKWQVEIDPFCRKVLEKHWPDVRRYEDVRAVGSELERVDVICGGFPCQDVSFAGDGAGLAGERSGLWREMARSIRVVRPIYALLENVAALLHRGMGTVLGDLADVGYDAEWDCLPARFVGADHDRDRVFAVAYPELPGRPIVLRGDGRERSAAHPSWGPADSLDTPVDRAKRIEAWLREPAILGSIDGVPAQLVGELGGYGNAIVPQIAEWIFRQIQVSEEARRS